MGNCLGFSSRSSPTEPRGPGASDDLPMPASGDNNGEAFVVDNHQLGLPNTPSNIRRRMTAKLWAEPALFPDTSEEAVEDQVAALRLQEFLKTHKDNMELGLLARTRAKASQFDERIDKLFEMRRPTGELIHRKDATRVHWLKSWVTTPFLIDFLEKNWSHVNFSPFMTLEDVENRLLLEYSAIVVRLSSTIPGFITVSCNAKETQQPIHVRYQVRADLSIRGEQDVSYPNFHIFIASFDQNMEGAPNRQSVDIAPNFIDPAPQTGIIAGEAKIAPGHPADVADSDDFERVSSLDPIARIGPNDPHVALYARTSDIRTWVRSENNQQEGDADITLVPG